MVKFFVGLRVSIFLLLYSLYVIKFTNKQMFLEFHFEEAISWAKVRSISSTISSTLSQNTDSVARNRGLRMQSGWILFSSTLNS